MKMPTIDERCYGHEPAATDLLAMRNAAAALRSEILTLRGNLTRERIINTELVIERDNLMRQRDALKAERQKLAETYLDCDKAHADMHNAMFSHKTRPLSHPDLAATMQPIRNAMCDIFYGEAYGKGANL
jgi:hypothetical protein